MHGRIAVMPVLTARDLAGGRRAAHPSILDVGKPVFLHSGSVAIRGALLHAALVPGDEVLVPAFNCPSMVTPVQEIGASPVFYGINEDLSIDAQKLAAAMTRRTKAALVPHLFGVLQNSAILRGFCDEAGIVLIEDCAHAFFGRNGAAALGAQGHYAIASPRKFLPLAEGGVLTSSTRDLRGLEVMPTTLSRTLRVSFDMVDLAVTHGRLSWAAPAVRGVKRLARRRAVGLEESASMPNVPTPTLRREVQAASGVTRLMIEHTATRSAIQRRRANFVRLLQGVRQLRGMKALDSYGDRLEQAVPYMLPILLSRPEEQFPRLKESGIPIWRWEYSRMGLCAVTDRYARALIQIPCHQSLSEAEVARLLLALSSVGGAGPAETLERVRSHDR